MRLLFVTSRNIYSTSGELRLIKNRAEVLKEYYDAITDFEVIRYKPHLKKPQETINSGDFFVYGHHLLDRPLVMKKIYKHIRSISKDRQYDAVVFSSVSVFSIMPKVKKLIPNAKFIADIHGAVEEMIEFPSDSFMKNLIQKAYYKWSKYNERKYLPLFDGFFAVSDALIEYAKKESNLDGKRFFKIPCSISDSAINVKEIIENRKIYRSKYKLQDNELLFVYSGGTSPWQCIDKSVKLFKDIKANNSCCSNAKMLIMTGQVDKVKQYTADDVLIDSYPGCEVRKVLCAADYAFLLRDDFVTNHVAYPNKFLEYVSCGLKIIATPYVYDVAEQIQKYDLGIIYDFKNPVVIDDKQYREGYLKDVENRNELFKMVSFKNTLQPFVEYIKR